MVEGIVLAAGESLRAGCFKMELPLGDKTLIERSIEGMYGVCSRIIVVGGYRVERVREILAIYSKVEVVENKSWQSGMFSSVKAGVALVHAGKFFLLPADVALVSQRVYRRLQLSGSTIVIPVYNKRKGHPILIDSSFIPSLLNEPNNSNMREMILRTGFETVEVDEETILLDVDTAEDYQKALDISNLQRD